MQYRYFVNGVERDVKDMTDEEKRIRALAMVEAVSGKAVSDEVAEKYHKKEKVTA